MSELLGVGLAPLAGGCFSARESTACLDGVSERTPHPAPPAAPGWTAPSVDLRAYDSLLFDTVEVRVAPGSAAATLGPETLARCAESLREVLVETIAPFYSVVARRGARTLRVRAALTDVRPDASDAVEGGAAIEAELLDAATGELLTAATSRTVPVAAALPESDDVPQRWRGAAGVFRDRARRLLDFLDSHDVRAGRGLRRTLTNTQGDPR